MASEEAIHFGPPPFRLSDMGPCKLSWSTPSYSPWGYAQMWVFWSTYNDELQHVNSQLQATGDIFTGDTVTKEKIKYILKHPRLLEWAKFLVQFWGLVKIGDKMYLTTCDQPFALSYFNEEGMKGLCEYRKLCLNYLIPVLPEIIFQEEEHGPPGRVFYSGLPEYVLDIRHYSPTEYPLYDYAVNRVKEYWVLPVKIPPGNLPIGVLEIVSSEGFFPDVRFLEVRFLEVLKDIGLSEQNEYDLVSRTFYLSANSCQEREIARINKVLAVVRKTHQLTLAQTWMQKSVKALIAVGTSSFSEARLFGFIHACRMCFWSVGQGLVGKAFSSKSAWYCRDVKQLSIKEYPLVPNARRYELSDCFAVCLQSSCSNNCTYTLEFFLPSNETNNGDPRTLLHMLMLTLKEQLQSSFKIASGQELGQKLFVEVIKVSSDDTLDSFEICHTSGSESAFGAAEVHSRRGIVPPDSSSQQVNAVNNSINGVHEQQIGFVGSPPAQKPVQNIVSTTHQQPNAELDAASRDRDGVSLEQSSNDETDLRKQRSSSNLQSERGITREVLEQNSTKKLRDAAEHLGVSRSTLKRICRNNGILRWPPHKARKNNQAFAQEKVAQSIVENNGQSRSDATRQQEHGSITVKATYGDDIIKFQLPFSARKMDLEKKVAQRLNLLVGNFKLKYLDEDDDWVLVTYDEDLSTTLSTLRLLGRTTLKMLVK